MRQLEAVRAQDLNPYEKNTKIIAIAATERETRLAEESNNDL